MRTLTKLIMASASLALVLGVAGQASATPSIDLVLLPGSDGVTCGAGCQTVSSTDVLRFAITMNIDTQGMAGYNFDLKWDTDSQDELDLVAFRQHGNQKQVGGLLTIGSPPVNCTKVTL